MTNLPKFKQYVFDKLSFLEEVFPKTKEKVEQSLMDCKTLEEIKKWANNTKEFFEYPPLIDNMLKNFGEMESDKGSVEHEENRLELHYPTDHLPYFSELVEASLLRGHLYTPILKGIWYCTISAILRDKVVEVGDLRTDLRVHLTIPLPSGQGKKNLKNIFINTLQPDPLNYSLHTPTHLHPEQLIGKVINRGTPRKPDWIRNEGYLSRDIVILDEGYQLLTNKDLQISESRKNLRLSKDCIGENRIEKKSVDNKFDSEEVISYFPKQITVLFLQPKKLPSDIVEEGDLRRDLVLYVKGMSSRDKQKDWKDRIMNESNDSESTNKFRRFLQQIKNESAGKEFFFTEEAKSVVVRLHKNLSDIGFMHSEKGKNFSMMVDWTMQDYLVKLCCILASSYASFKITPAIVEFAFMDLVEFFNMQLDFVDEKVHGKLDYGEGWAGSFGKEQQCLEWLYNNGGLSKETSKVSIQEFCSAIAEIMDCKETQSRNYWYKFRKRGWVDGGQEGQHGSKVWLNFTPASCDRKTIPGCQDDKGATPYESIFLNIKEKKTFLPALPPLTPLSSSDIETVKVEDRE